MAGKASAALKVLKVAKIGFNQFPCTIPSDIELVDRNGDVLMDPTCVVLDDRVHGSEEVVQELVCLLRVRTC